MTRRVWACENCGWEWPLVTGPPEDAECDACGGPMEEVARSLVATMDLIEEVARRPRLSVGPNPGENALRFARRGEHLACIEHDGRRVGAVVFGTGSLPYKVIISGDAHASFASWRDAVAFVADFRFAEFDVTVDW